MMRQTGKLGAVSVFVLAATVGCGSDETECGQAGPFTVATFNAGLARGDVEHVEERVAPVSEALAALDVDLLCVQEYWEDWDALAAAATGLPNRVHQPPMTPCPEGACTMADLEPMIECGEQYGCDQLEGEPMLTCMSDNCMDVVNQYPQCVPCIIENAGTFQDVIDACVGGEGSGETYLYGCGFDTGILTSAPVVAQESRELGSFLVKAGVDFARVDAQGGEVDVYCTHLQSKMDFTYGGAHGSYEEEQAAQIDQLLAFIAERSDATRPVVLLGDLNTGPEIAEANITGEWPEHYDRLLAAGFDNPYTAQADVACTLCPDNTLRASDSTPLLIDHILLKNASSEATCSRIMTETTTIDTGGGTVESSYSDHHGLRLELAGWCSE